MHIRPPRLRTQIRKNPHKRPIAPQRIMDRARTMTNHGSRNFHSIEQYDGYNQRAQKRNAHTGPKARDSETQQEKKTRPEALKTGSIEECRCRKFHCVHMDFSQYTNTLTERFRGNHSAGDICECSMLEYEMRLVLSMDSNSFTCRYTQHLYSR